MFRKFTNLYIEKPKKRKKFAASLSDRDKIIILNHKFFAWLKNKLTVDSEEYSHFKYTSAEAYQDALAQLYKAHTKNYLNRAVFGKMDHHKDFERQVRYLETGIVKPMKATINQAFSRLESLVMYLSYFPPRSKANKVPGRGDHARFGQI